MEPDELESRLSAAEENAAAALVLARAVDRDVAEVRDFRRAVVRSFNALRTEIHERFAAVYRMFGGVDRRLDAVDNRFDGVYRRFDAVDRRFDDVDVRFDAMDQRFAEVGMEFASIDRGFTEMRGRLDAAAAGQQQIVGLLETLIDDQGKRPD